MFTLQHVDGITADQIEKQRQIWMAKLFALPTVVEVTEQRLLQAALLERAIAGLVLDSFSGCVNTSIGELLHKDPKR